VTKRMEVGLSLGKKRALAAAGMATLGLVTVVGIRTTTARAQSASPQTAGGPFPKFEIVSIKSCKPGTPGEREGRVSAPGRLNIGCGMLADTDNTGMIQVAYNRYAGGQLNSYRVIPIEGGPDWIHSESFEINAESDGHPSILMMEGPMMQTILEDRFKLQIHRKTRQGLVYELALGTGSPKLKPLQDGSCIPVVIGRPLPLLPGGKHICRNMVNLDFPRAVEMEGGTLSSFTGLLGMALDRPVIDKTGITGNFEIHLVFSPNDSAAPRPVAADLSIVQAIQEQLGLRLVPAKGPVDALVIDHIERPSEN
jgi:uncharacterized protein (TIGR03435 family)